MKNCIVGTMLTPPNAVYHLYLIVSFCFHCRSKPIVWMVSRCHTLSRREVYAKDLKQHIDIDIFGECGRPAPRKGSPPINIDFRTELGKLLISEFGPDDYSWFTELFCVRF